MIRYGINQRQGLRHQDLSGDSCQALLPFGEPRKRGPPNGLSMLFSLSHGSHDGLPGDTEQVSDLPIGLPGMAALGQLPRFDGYVDLFGGHRARPSEVFPLRACVFDTAEGVGADR